MTPWAATLAVLVMLALAAFAQYLGTVAFLAAFPADSPLPGAVRVVEIAALFIFGPVAGGLARPLRTRPSADVGLRVLVGAVAPPPVPEYPEVATAFPGLCAVAAIIVGWWAIFALSIMVIPVKTFEAHWLWVAGIEVIAPLVAMVAIIGTAQPLFTPLPAPQPGRII